MSDLLANSLKSRLMKLECHFTWEILKTHFDIDYTEERASKQLEYLPPASRHRTHNLLAYIKHLKQDNEKAIDHVQSALKCIQEIDSDENNANLVTIYGNYAWLCYHTNQFQEAEVYIGKVEAILNKFETSSNCDHLRVEMYCEQGWALLTFTAKYYEKAKECFLKGLEIDPDSPELNSGYATVVYRIECFVIKKLPAEYSSSLEPLKKAVALNPEDSVMKALLALKYQDLKQFENGREMVEAALLQTPDLPYLLRHVAKFYRRGNMFIEAINILRKALRLTPKAAALHHQMGLCYKQEMYMLKRSSRNRMFYNHRQINENLRNAIVCFEKTVEHDRAFVTAYNDLAHMYAEQGDSRKAEETFEKVLNLESLTREELQEIHFSYGRYEEYHRKSESEAIRHYMEAIRIPESTNMREYSKENLVRLAENIIGRDPSNATGYALLAFIHHQTGETDQAIDNYIKAYNCDPDNEYLSSLTDLRLEAGL